MADETVTIRTIPDAYLAVVEVIADSLVWVFVDEDESPVDDERLQVFRNIGDMLVTDLGLTITGVAEDGTIQAELRLTEPDEE